MSTTERPDARRIERYEAPNYLARYRERQNAPTEAAQTTGDTEDTAVDGSETPLYLRRFRQRGGLHCFCNVAI